jgi:hypothetical protein
VGKFYFSQQVFFYLEIVEERIAENPPQVGKLHVLLLETGLVPVALLLQLLHLAVRVARLRAQLLILGVQLLRENRDDFLKLLVRRTSVVVV